MSNILPAQLALPHRPFVLHRDGYPADG